MLIDCFSFLKCSHLQEREHIGCKGLLEIFSFNHVVGWNCLQAHLLLLLVAIFYFRWLNTNLLCVPMLKPQYVRLSWLLQMILSEDLCILLAIKKRRKESFFKELSKTSKPTGDTLAKVFYTFFFFNFFCSTYCHSLQLFLMYYCFFLFYYYFRMELWMIL